MAEIAWAIMRASASESLEEVELSREEIAGWLLRDLDNPLSPSNLFDTGELSPKLRNALKEAVAA